MRTNRRMSGSSSTMRTVGIDVERRPRRPSRSGSGRPWASAHELLGEADPGDPLLRLTDLGEAGQPAGAAPHRLERVRAAADRKSGVSGKSVEVSVAPGGRRFHKKKKK